MRASSVRSNISDIALCMQLTDPTAQARVVYGPKYPDGSTFDVVTSSPKYLLRHRFLGLTTGHVSWVVVYPKTKPYSAGTVVSAEWEPVLQSSVDLSLNSTLNELLSQLRRKLDSVMGKWRSSNNILTALLR